MGSTSDQNVEDIFSRLPEEILSHILSLMPTKSAVQTSILSKRWRYRWMFITNLDFDDACRNPFHSFDKFTKFVDRVLECCKTSQVKLFRLNFSEIRVRKSSVSSWIDKAVKLKVSELDIHFIPLELPLNLFTCKTLTRLRLECRVCDGNDWECPSSINLPCLKDLDVVVYNNPFANAFKLIRGCPMLESLSLEVMGRKKFEQDYIFNIPTLKRFKLVFASIIFYKVINKVFLHVPNLEYLCVGGVLCSLFVMEDVSSHLWAELLNGVRGVNSLLTHVDWYLIPSFTLCITLDFVYVVCVDNKVGKISLD